MFLIVSDWWAKWNRTRHQAGQPFCEGPPLEQLVMLAFLTHFGSLQRVSAARTMDVLMSAKSASCLSLNFLKSDFCSSVSARNSAEDLASNFCMRRSYDVSLITDHTRTWDLLKSSRSAWWRCWSFFNSFSWFLTRRLISMLSGRFPRLSVTSVFGLRLPTSITAVFGLRT